MAKGSVQKSRTRKPLWKCCSELARLHKFPSGTILVFWPCAWGITMAAYTNGLPLETYILQFVMFALGSTLLHSAACVINDICDKDFDSQVERTKTRPLPSGDISVFGATVFLISLVGTCAAMLLYVNKQAALAGLFGIFPLHAFYPLMKRWTNWPQAWLGLAMNWGLPVAWLTITTELAPNQWKSLTTLFVGTIFWTLVYDTIYACQDRKDDAKAGVKSTALLFGDWVRPILLFFAAIFVGTILVAGAQNEHGSIFYLVSGGGAIAHLAWQFITWKVDSPADCGAKFESNGVTGAIIWAGMALEYYNKVY